MRVRKHASGEGAARAHAEQQQVLQQRLAGEHAPSEREKGRALAARVVDVDCRQVDAVLRDVPFHMKSVSVSKKRGGYRSVGVR